MPIFIAGVAAGLWVRSELDSDAPFSLGTIVVGAVVIGGGYLALKKFS